MEQGKEVVSATEPAPTPVVERTQPASYAGISEKAFTKAQQDVLLEKVKPEDLDILPTGEVYLTQVRYRNRLNAAFGCGAWALRPVSDIKTDGNTMMRAYALYIEGRFISEAIGECEWQASNDRMTRAQAIEGCKSNALVRCCKDIGIASECWDKHFTTEFQDKYCVRVWVDKKQKPQWRLKTAKPFYGETGPADDKPAPKQEPRAAAPRPQGTSQAGRELQRAQTAGASKDYELTGGKKPAPLPPASQEREPGEDDMPPLTREQVFGSEPKPGDLSAGWKQTKSRWENKCAGCKGRIAKDEFMYYNQSEKTCRCMSCRPGSK